MEKAINRLGLTDEDRAITYTDNGVSRIAEVRHYDPVMGLLKIIDPMSGFVHEMIYNRDLSKWFVPGTNITCDWNIEEPVVKQIDTQEGDVPVTIKRFPSSPLDQIGLHYGVIMEQVERVDTITTQVLGLKELAQLVAVIDTCASRGSFKADEFSTIGRLREILIAESQIQNQARQQVAEQQVAPSLDGGKTEGNETSEPVVDAREKLKRSKGKK